MAPGDSEQQAWDQAKGIEEMRNIEQEDLDANAQLFQQQPTAPLLQRFRHSETLRLSGEVKHDDVTVLLTAPTRVLHPIIY